MIERMKGAAALAALDGQLFATPAEVATVLGKDTRTIWAALDRGDIPSTRLGRNRQVPTAWLHRQVQGVPA